MATDDALTTGRLPLDCFASRLRALRHDLTLAEGRPVPAEECAGAVGVATATWTQWERGAALPNDPPATAATIEGTWGFDASWLLDGQATGGRVPRDSFGARLAALRHDLALRSGRTASLEKCAEAIEASPAAWRQWEREIARPRHFRATASHIARTFGYSEDWLVGDPDESEGSGESEAS